MNLWLSLSRQVDREFASAVDKDEDASGICFYRSFRARACVINEGLCRQQTSHNELQKNLDIQYDKYSLKLKWQKISIHMTEDWN